MASTINLGTGIIYILMCQTCAKTVRIGELDTGFCFILKPFLTDVFKFNDTKQMIVGSCCPQFVSIFFITTNDCSF